MLFRHHPFTETHLAELKPNKNECSTPVQGEKKKLGTEIWVTNIEQIRINHIKCKLFVPQSQQIDLYLLICRTTRINKRQF
jgi:hypothetical protein